MKVLLFGAGAAAFSRSSVSGTQRHSVVATLRPA
jgi:hypothetical protein